jgi:hypothetical protein
MTHSSSALRQTRTARTPLAGGKLPHLGKVADLIAFPFSPVECTTAQDVHCDPGLCENLMGHKFYADA